jgi:predicted NBD/HSP70 family sugar kinase
MARQQASLNESNSAERAIAARSRTRVATLVFDELRLRGPLTRAQLQMALRASPVTITAAVRELTARQLVIERGEGISTGGRRAHLLDLGPRVGGVLAVDIGSIRLRVAAADMRGRIVARRTVDSPARPDRRRLRKLFGEVANGLGGPVRAVGVGLAAAVYPDGSIQVAPTMPEWDGYDFNRLFTDFDAPVLIENESNLAGLGEHRKGGHPDSDPVLFVAIGAGIGGSLILGGDIYTGATGRAGELGDLRTGLVRGLELESKAGVHAIVKRYRELGGRGSADAEIVFQLAAQGDTAAGAAVQQAIEEIALALVNATSLIDPARIVIGGGLAAAGDFLLEPVRALMEPHLLKVPEIVASRLGADATLHGGIEWALDRGSEELLDQVNSG